MRTDCEWFARRAKAIWKSQPGRSILVLVPQGCDEGGTVKLVRRWVEQNFILPAGFSNHKPVFIGLVTDGFESSAHFVHSVAQQISRQLGIKIEGASDDYPSDKLQNAIEAAAAAGFYPILMIQRFHAFASIRDGGMTSILSRLRTLESDAQLTTLAFSPINYSAIRRAMDGEQPFLNSVYGDMHDEAVMSPLSRDEFIVEAQSRGIAQALAQRLFKLGGGPDSIFKTLLDLHESGLEFLVNRCSDRAGPAIDLFLERALPKDPENEALLAGLALGRLNPAQEAFLLNHPLGSFLLKRNSTGEMICSSPIISRRILSSIPLSAQYMRCIVAFEAGDYLGAGEMAANLSESHPRLATFKELVVLRSCLTANPERGLLGIDWRAAVEALRRLRSVSAPVSPSLQRWLDVVSASTGVVLQGSGAKRLQIDDLTRRASDSQVRLLLLFMFDEAVCSARKLSEPTARVRWLVNVPEAILQSLASGFCEIDFSKPPSSPPDGEYDMYFGNTAHFRFPSGEQKMTLSSLLVVVPALLAERKIQGAVVLIDPVEVRPLQQKLVDAVRNPASHTIADFAQKDAMMLEQLCRSWLSEWCRMENLDSANELPIRSLAPNTDQLRALLFGEDAFIASNDPELGSH